eukprot:5359979-Pleurochrysis_carterae.AAC.1
MCTFSSNAAPTCFSFTSLRLTSLQGVSQYDSIAYRQDGLCMCLATRSVRGIFSETGKVIEIYLSRA